LEDMQNELNLSRFTGNPTRAAETGPQPEPKPEANALPLLGTPMNIRQVARLIGCSPWTVRQKHIPSGLPYFRSAASGRLIFYHDQVVRWILRQQAKGGIRP
jgi:hypothetical protein